MSAPQQRMTAEAAQAAVAAAISMANSTARPENVAGLRTPFIPWGTHRLTVLSVEPDVDQDGQVKVWVNWLCSETTNPHVRTPSEMVTTFNLNEGPAFPGGEKPSDRWVKLIMELCDMENDLSRGAESALGRLNFEVLGPRAPDQLLRGYTVEATGEFTGKPPPGQSWTVDPDGSQWAMSEGKRKNRFVKVVFFGVEQTQDNVREMREFLDAEYPYRPRQRVSDQGGRSTAATAAPVTTPAAAPRAPASSALARLRGK